MDSMLWRMLKYKNDKGLSLQKLANELQVSRMTIYRWKKGQPMSKPQKRLIRAYFRTKKIYIP